MCNLRDFATSCIINYAISLAKPNSRGAAFTWKDSFPRMAINHTQRQWFMYNRNPKIIQKRIKEVEEIAIEVSKDFMEITGKP